MQWEPEYYFSVYMNKYRTLPQTPSGCTARCGIARRSCEMARLMPVLPEVRHGRLPKHPIHVLPGPSRTSNEPPRALEAKQDSLSSGLPKIRTQNGFFPRGKAIPSGTTYEFCGLPSTEKCLAMSRCRIVLDPKVSAPACTGSLAVIWNYPPDCLFC